MLVALLEETDNYACAWTKDLATGKPLICVAGANAKIKIIDVQSGTIQRVCEPIPIYKHHSLTFTDTGGAWRGITSTQPKTGLQADDIGN
ncbi:wd domain-containing protein [Rutstroemia sp. NJR-2017a BBW]|nr:wd domain-containing protein [Rutstroemia sp. NJR-2017a BBW]